MLQSSLISYNSVIDLRHHITRVELSPVSAVTLVQAFSNVFPITDSMFMINEQTCTGRFGRQYLHKIHIKNH